MVNVSIARRYARALLESSGAGADKVLEQLQTLVRELEASPELADVVNNPAYTRSERDGVVEQLLKTNYTDPVLANLIRLLNDRKRLGQLGDVARVYRDLVDVSMGRVRGKVTSAIELSDLQLKSVAQSLEKLTQRDVLLEAKVDKALLGGISAQVGSVVYDGSLRNQLEVLARGLS